MRKSLTKREIVKKKPEIDKIFISGASFSCPGIKLRLAKNQLDVNRIIVIPVKHYGNAVQRNRIRRQIKEVWRLEKNNFISGFDFAFVVYPRMAVSHEQQKKQLTRLFKEAHLYR
ncbi:MAG: ribonuclease P protein component [Spirochaetia bacterium]|nr:ribonuclease P protein component [Spirochaetia bacterium]